MTLVRRIGSPATISRAPLPPAGHELLARARDEIIAFKEQHEIVTEALAKEEASVLALEDRLVETVTAMSELRGKLHDIEQVVNRKRWWPFMRKHTILKLLGY